MKIHVNLEWDIPDWLRHGVRIALPALVVLGGSGIAWAAIAEFKAGDPLSASAINTLFNDLDARVSAVESRQIVVGDVQTAHGGRAASSFGAFDTGTPTVSFQAASTGRYRIYGIFAFGRLGGCTAGARIGHVGDAPVYLTQPVVIPTGGATQQEDIVGSLLVEAIVELQAGQSYSFQLEGNGGGCGTLHLRSDLLSNVNGPGVRLVAEQL